MVFFTLTEIIITPLNQTFDYINADRGILREITDHFTFFAQGYKFHPKYKAGFWDGKLRLLNPNKPQFYCGLREELAKFCLANDYVMRFAPGCDELDHDFSMEDGWSFANSLDLPTEMNGLPFEPRDYQIDAFVQAVRKRRLTLISPTASGKSLIIYLILRYFNKKTLIIVPNLGLVKQMKGDFGDYNYDVENVHQIFSGQEKNVDKPVVVSTWQSLKNMPASYFKQFEVLICDEVHGAKANELKNIVERMTDCAVRIGTSGTLDGAKANELTIQGLFGPIHKVTTTAKLIADGRLAAFDIKAILLEHSPEIRKAMARSKYPDEMQYLIASESRNNFIANLANSLKGNTLILYQFVEKHGEPLYEMIKKKTTNPVLFVSGKIESEDRENIRKFVNGSMQSITVASKGTFSTGTNIPNIDNIIFASPAKARIQTLQSIGRGLRLSSRKSKCTLYDIADDLSYKTWTNHTLTHFTERVRIYNQEEFLYKIFQVPLS